MRALLLSIVLLSILLLACSRQTETTPLPSTQPTSQSTQTTAPDEPAACKHPVTTKGIGVACVIDGDTIKLTDGTSVRLIGMDAPEKGEYGYSNATELLVNLLNKSYVHMEKDVSDVDRFGRQLRYVYATDYLLNQYIVEEGWARAADYPPDTARSRLLHNAEQQAKDKKLGIWSS